MTLEEQFKAIEVETSRELLETLHTALADAIAKGLITTQNEKAAFKAAFLMGVATCIRVLKKNMTTIIATAHDN